MTADALLRKFDVFSRNSGVLTNRDDHWLKDVLS